MGLAATKLMTLAPKVGIALLSADADAASGLDVTKLISDSVSSTQLQVFSVLGIVVPAIVGIVSAVVCIKFGISWLKKIRG